MIYSEEVIDAVLNSVNIVNIIGSCIPLEKKGEIYIGYCPFHSDKVPTLSVSEKKQRFFCFGCGNGGTAYGFVMNYFHVSFATAIEYIASVSGYPLPPKKQVKDIRAVMLECNRQAENFFFYQSKGESLTYLHDRKVSDETREKFGIGYAPGWDKMYQTLSKMGYSEKLMEKCGLINKCEEGEKKHDKFYGRVMFPIYNIYNQIIGFGGRVTGKSVPKYLNTKETLLFNKRENLYGLNFAIHSSRPGFIVCEGYMDVIAQHQAGFDNAIASLGTAFTEEQARLIRQFRDTVYLAYDSDEAGVKACLRAIQICNRVGLNSCVIDLQPYKDPDEFIKNMGIAEYEQRILSAAGGKMYSIMHEAKGYIRGDKQLEYLIAQELLK